MLLLIDDQGETWDGSSRQLRLAFDSPFSGGEFVDYAVLNLGFIATNVFGKAVQIRLRPLLTTDGAVSGLKELLQRHRFERVVISSYDGEWSNELIGSVPAAIARLNETLSESRLALSGDFLTTKVGPKDIPTDTAIGQIVRHWPRLSQQAGPHVLMDLLRAALGDRYVKVKMSSTGEKVVFHEIGNGLYGNYDTWRACAVGAPIEEQPDRQFGRWVASTYSEVLKSQEPVLENVDAIVRWPHAGRTRLRYKRFILPLPMESGSDVPMALGGSLLDNFVDLRIRRV